MFTRLFSASGLSLDRLRGLVEVGAHGSIVGAAAGDPIRQSLYSRQIKELEDFFQTTLLERHGKGVRLTAQGRELARISRFFLLGLSNFQRGCLSETQRYRIGADASFHTRFLVAVLCRLSAAQSTIRFIVETVAEGDLERRLHDLTLDFAIVRRSPLSRPLQTKLLGTARVILWVPKRLCRSLIQAERDWKAGRLPIIWPGKELTRDQAGCGSNFEPVLECDDFLQVQSALSRGKLAGILPEYFLPEPQQDFFNLDLAQFSNLRLSYHLAWNPRLLRLNPHAGRRRDALVTALSAEFSSCSEL